MENEAEFRAYVVLLAAPYSARIGDCSPAALRTEEMRFALAAQLGVARAQNMGSGSCPCVSTVRAAPAPALRPLRACALRPLRLCR